MEDSALLNEHCEVLEDSALQSEHCWWWSSVGKTPALCA